MTYSRVLPRDAFNEGNLLKCIGVLTLHALGGRAPGLTYEFADNAGFAIEQDESSGAIFVNNLKFSLHNQRVVFWRPLNSREAYPLYCSRLGYEDDVPVFNYAGDLTPEYHAFAASLSR